MVEVKTGRDVLKLELRRFDDSWNVGGKVKRGIKNDSVFWLEQLGACDIMRGRLGLGRKFGDFIGGKS